MRRDPAGKPGRVKLLHRATNRLVPTDHCGSPGRLHRAWDRGHSQIEKTQALTSGTHTGLCVDEKSQIQGLDRTAPLLPLRPGLPERQTHDYKRHGTTTLFAAFNILNGKVIGSCLLRHRGKEFIKFLHQLEQQVPPELALHLILDNYSTPKSAAVQRWRKPMKRRRFHFHFIATSGSWLNQVERWFGLITDKMIRRGTFHSEQELERAIYAWLASWNDTPKPFAWEATADLILDKVRRCKELAGTAR
jgi:transposase